MTKSATIKRGLKQAIRHQKGKQVAGLKLHGEPRKSLVDFVRGSPLAGMGFKIGRSRDTGRRG